MAPVYHEIKLEWRGTTYRVTPTYANIQALEQQISLLTLVGRTLDGRPPMSHLADVLAEVLRWAGCPAEDARAEDINAELYHGDNRVQLLEAARLVLFALLPRESLPGNPPAPESGASDQPTSTGDITTRSPSGTLGSSLRSSGE